MAKPSDYLERRRRIRYSSSYNDVGICSVPVLRYENVRGSVSSSQHDTLVKMILDAIGRMEEFRFIREVLMPEKQPSELDGGEVTGEEPTPKFQPTRSPAANHRQRAEADLRQRQQAEATHRQKMSRLESIGRGAPSMHYQRTRDVDCVELYERRQHALREACASFDRVVESRREISDKAAEHAMLHGTSYNEALRAVGGSVPSVRIPPSTVR